MATTDLERLIISVEANTSKIESQLEKLISTVDGSFKKVTTSTDTMVSKIEAGFAKAGEIFAGFFAVEKIRGFIEGLGETADKLKSLSERTGESVETLQKFQAAGRQSNITSDEMSHAMDVLARNLGKAGTQHAQLGIIMRQYGIEPAKDLTGTLLNVADAVQKAATRTDEARIVQAAFGRSSSELIGFLRQGSDAIRTYADGYKDFMTTDTVLKLAEFNTAWKELQVTFTNLAAGPAAQFLGEITDFLKELQKGDWTDKLGLLWKYLNTPITDMWNLTGAEKELDALMSKRFTLQKLANQGDSLQGKEAQAELARLDVEILAKKATLESSYAGKIQSKIPGTEAANKKDYGNERDLSAIDQYMAKVKLTAELAGLDADQKERANDLIAAATAKLGDEGNAHKVLLDSMQAVTRELGTQNVARIDAARQELHINEIILARKQLIEGATATTERPQPINEAGLSAQVAKDNLAGIDAAVKQLDVKQKIDYREATYLDKMKEEVRLASLMPREREEELALLDQRNQYGIDFAKQHEDEIRGMVRAKQAASDMLEIQTAAVGAVASFGDTMTASGGKFGKAVASMLTDLATLIIKLELTRALTASIGAKGGGSSGGGGGIIGGLLGLVGSLFGGGDGIPDAVAITPGVFGGGRAGGGPVTAGNRYRVGELGAEDFVPTQSGRIIPNSGRSGGSGGMSINVVVNGARGNTEITQMVNAGVGSALANYDRQALPSRVARIMSDPQAR